MDENKKILEKEEKTSVTGMTTNEKVIAGIVVLLFLLLNIGIMLIAMSSASKSTVKKTVGDQSKKIEAYYADIDLKIDSIKKRVTGVEADGKILWVMAEENAKRVDKLYKEAATLGKKLSKTRKLAETHGRKINDLSETVFKAAYGVAWADSGKVVWNQYVLCGNQDLWNKVVKRLTPKQMQKIIQIDQLNQRIETLEDSVEPVDSIKSKVWPFY